MTRRLRSAPLIVLLGLIARYQVQVIKDYERLLDPRRVSAWDTTTATPDISVLHRW